MVVGRLATRHLTLEDIIVTLQLYKMALVGKLGIANMNYLPAT